MSSKIIRFVNPPGSRSFFSRTDASKERSIFLKTQIASKISKQSANSSNVSSLKNSLNYSSSLKNNVCSSSCSSTI